MDLLNNIDKTCCLTPSQTVILDAQWGRLIACLPQLDSVDLIEDSLAVGRSDECDIVIHKSKFPQNQLFFISKKHFILKRDPLDKNITYLTDLSKNGTFVNSHQVGRNKTIILQNNDFIAIGEKLIVYSFKYVDYAVDNGYLPLNLKSKYVPSDILGKGACGEVRLAYNKITCKKYAIKKIIKGKNSASQTHNVNHPSRINREINILQCLSHPLIVKMEEIWETENEVYIILEYLKGGELTSKLSSSSNLSESSIKFLFYQMVLAVQYLHSKGITHRDLKPSNVLLVSSDTYSLIKLTDFGLSNISEDYTIMNTVCGTWHYIAPEILNPNISNYNHQVDIWSLGVMLYYMLSRKLPFNSHERCILERMILHGEYSMEGFPWYEISSEAKDLIKRMLIVNPNQRIKLDDILTHPWINKDSLMQFTVDKMITSSEMLVPEEEKSEYGGPKMKRICQRGC